MSEVLRRTCETTANSALTEAGIFHQLERPVGERLRRERFRAGQRIFVEGEHGDRLYVIDSGKVKISQRAPDGREQLQTVLGPPQMFGELAVYDPGPRTSTATALTSVRTLALDGAQLRGWVADQPEIAERLLRLLARRLRRTIENWTDVISHDVPARLAKQLLQLAQQFGCQEDGATDVWHDLTQEELAQLLGASRENVNKALAEFSARGWIRLADKGVMILDSERLTQRARQS
jgi:CRP/FNR family transcriptional regulator, cyclic AMP receptor protein